MEYIEIVESSLHKSKNEESVKNFKNPSNTHKKCQAPEIVLNSAIVLEENPHTEPTNQTKVLSPNDLPTKLHGSQPNRSDVSHPDGDRLGGLELGQRSELKVHHNNHYNNKKDEHEDEYRQTSKMVRAAEEMGMFCEGDSSVNVVEDLNALNDKLTITAPELKNDGNVLKNDVIIPNMEESLTQCQGQDINASSTSKNPSRNNSQHSQHSLRHSQSSNYNQPKFEQTQYGQPQHGNNSNYYQPSQHSQSSNYNQPQFGQPQYGQPQYGQPQYGQPQYGQPQYGQPQYGQPHYGKPPNSQHPPPIVIVETSELLENQFEDPELRKAFILKTYNILLVDLIVMFGCVAAAAFAPGADEFLFEHQTPIITVSLVSYCFMMVVSCCFPECMLYPPWAIVYNVTMVIGLTGMMVFFQARFAPSVVAMSIGATLAVVAGLTLLACCVPIDFTKWWPYLLVVFLVFAVFGIIAPFVYSREDFKIVHYVLACIGAGIFSVFILMDTQMLMGNKKNKLSPDMHWFAASQLFVDIWNLLYYMLTIMGSSD